MKKIGFLVGIFTLVAGAASAQTAEELLKKCDDAYGKAKYADAVKHCTKAIEKRPGFEEAIMARAFAYEKLGNVDAAITDHTELIRLTGMAQFYFYRAGIYLDRGRKDDALADLSAAIQKEPAGRYAARSHYKRGLIYEERGKIAEAQADFRRTVQLNPDNKDAAKRIKPDPFGALLDDGPLSTAADRIVENIFVDPTKPNPILDVPFPAGKTPAPQPKKTPVSVPADWKRMALTGTGLSVASPKPFVLYSDKPSDFNLDSEAEVWWGIQDGELGGYIKYKKINMGHTSIRHPAEEKANEVFGKPKALDKIVADTTFLGEPGAFFDEEHIEKRRNIMVRETFAVFGKPNEWIEVWFYHAADDAVAAEKCRQIIASFKKEGTRATPQPKMSAPDWNVINVNGLNIEVPVRMVSQGCNSLGDMPGTTEYCGKWQSKNGKDGVDVRISYTEGNPAYSITVTEIVARHIQGIREIEGKDATYNPTRRTLPINFGEAIKLETRGDFLSTDDAHIRYKNGYWKVSISYGPGPATLYQASTRIINSLKF